MSIMFPIFGKKNVHIGIDAAAGTYIEVPMLSVEDYGQFKDLQFKASEVENKATVQEKRDLVDDITDQLIKLAQKVMPIELHDRIKTMPYGDLSSLVLILCTGKDNSEEDDPQKKMTLPSQMANPPKS